MPASSTYRILAALTGALLFLAALAPFLIVRSHHGTQQLTNLRERERMILKQEQLRQKANKRNANPAPILVRPASEEAKPSFHFVVSSDCSPFQRWQVLTQIHSAIDVGTTGRYTWIMSGCPVTEVKGNKRLDHKSKPHGQDGSLLGRASVLADVQRSFPALCGESAQADSSDPSKSLGCPSVHFTPDFSDMSIYGGPYADGKKRRFYTNKDGKTTYSSYGNTYYFMNKPSGLKHWSDDNASTSFDKDANEAIVLIDPDFIFMKKFDVPGNITARPGAPIAAHYGLGDQWLDFNLTKICGPDSLCARTTSKVTKEKGLSAGPPYVIHAHDVNALATRWKELVPPTYEEYPLLYAEMFAYSAAAADLDLPHTLVHDIVSGCMVSWPRNVDIKTVQPVAERFIDSFDASVNDILLPEEGVKSCSTDDIGQTPLLHFCKRYPFRINNGTHLVLAKRRVPHDAVDCDNDEALMPWQDEGKEPSPKGFKRNKEELWNALGVCAIIRGVAFAKEQGCKIEKTA